MKGRWAIINVSDLCWEFWYLLTLRSCCSTHHRRLIRFWISDRKFVNHTTEMILWSMILTLHHQSCPYDKPGIRQQIGEQKLGTIWQNGLPWLICHSQILIADHILTTLTLEKIVLVQSSAPSIGRWASLSSPRGRDLGIIFPFLHLSCPHFLLDAKSLGNWFLYQRYEKYWILHTNLWHKSKIFINMTEFAEPTWVEDASNVLNSTELRWKTLPKAQQTTCNHPTLFESVQVAALRASGTMLKR